MSNRVFSVLLLRKDQQHMQISQSPNYEEMRKLWSRLTDQWAFCVKENRPFILDDNITATAFDPGIISEIKLHSIELTNRINPNNPYMNDMQQNGFSETFGKYTKGTPGTAEELLDRGFNF